MRGGLSVSQYLHSVSRKSAKGIKKYWVLYLLALPCIAYLLIFKYYPILLQTILSFKDYKLMKGVWGSQWTGLGNYIYIFTSPDMLRVIWNTIYISLLRLLTGFFPPIILSILLFDLRVTWLKRTCQTILYIPHFFAWTIIYAIVYAMFSSSGFINSLLMQLGLNSRNFLMDRNSFFPLLLGSALWKEIGWNTIIYFAALTTINVELYEPASIDGAGPIRKIRHITLPGIKNVVIFLLILNLGNILRGGGTEQLLLFDSPPIYDMTEIIDTWVYRQGLSRLRYSLGCAMSFFQAVFGLLLILGCNKLAVRYSNIGLW
jgi:putative aldouronate transport system permease protein